MPRGKLNSNPFIKPADQRCRDEKGRLCRCFKTCTNRRKRNQQPERMRKIATKLEGSIVPAETLAIELGVTPRTIYRDIVLMRKVGVPVEGMPGIAGGLTIRKPYCAERTGVVG